MTQVPEKGLNLLFAEDDDEDWMLIEEALEDCPNEVKYSRVKNGEELVSRLKSGMNKPDMIILDLRMPVRDGFWALQQIRANPKLRHLPITVMTTSETEVDIVGSYAKGANAYLVKPPSFEDMHKLLHETHRFWSQIARLPNLEEQTPAVREEDTLD